MCCGCHGPNTGAFDWTNNETFFAHDVSAARLQGLLDETIDHMYMPDADFEANCRCGSHGAAASRTVTQLVPRNGLHTDPVCSPPGGLMGGAMRAHIPSQHVQLFTPVSHSSTTGFTHAPLSPRPGSPQSPQSPKSPSAVRVPGGFVEVGTSAYPCQGHVQCLANSSSSTLCQRRPFQERGLDCWGASTAIFTSEPSRVDLVADGDEVPPTPSYTSRECSTSRIAFARALAPKTSAGVATEAPSPSGQSFEPGPVEAAYSIAPDLAGRPTPTSTRIFSPRTFATTLFGENHGLFGFDCSSSRSIGGVAASNTSISFSQERTVFGARGHRNDDAAEGAPPVSSNGVRISSRNLHPVVSGSTDDLIRTISLPLVRLVD